MGVFSDENRKRGEFKTKHGEFISQIGISPYFTNKNEDFRKKKVGTSCGKNWETITQRTRLDPPSLQHGEPSAKSRSSNSVTTNTKSLNR
jgi:hypothetical protein